MNTLLTLRPDGEFVLANMLEPTIRIQSLHDPVMVT